MTLLRLLRPRCLSYQPNVFRTFVTSAPLRSDAPASPILSRLRNDLKTAMRAKDTPRLNVLRALLAEITNASKTAKPIENDATLYLLLNKQIASSEKAVEEFASAKRDDLVQKETLQMDVLKGYKHEIPTVTQDDMDKVINSVVDELKAAGKVQVGPAMGKVLETLGKDKVVDSRYISTKIKELTSANS